MGALVFDVTVTGTNNPMNHHTFEDRVWNDKIDFVDIVALRDNPQEFQTIGRVVWLTHDGHINAMCFAGMRLDFKEELP